MCYFIFSYLFHYISDDRVIYLCITDDVSTHVLKTIYLRLPSIFPKCVGGLSAFMRAWLHRYVNQQRQIYRSAKRV